MFHKKLIIIAWIGLFLAGCTSNKTGLTSSRDQGEVILTFARGACFGRCPVYQLNVMSDGNFVFEARRFMNPIGVSVGKITGDQWNDLVSKLDKLDWSAYQEYYDSNIPDLPSTDIQWRGKKVSFKEEVPTALEELSAEMHELFLDMDKGQLIYKSPGDHMDTKDLEFTLKKGCTLDKSFQIIWGPYAQSIVPLTEEISAYQLRLKPYTLTTGEAYARLLSDPCIQNVNIL